MMHKVRNLLVIHPVVDKQQMFLDKYIDHTPKLNSAGEGHYRAHLFSVANLF